MNELIKMQRVIMEMELAGHLKLAAEMRKILAEVAELVFKEGPL